MFGSGKRKRTVLVALIVALLAIGATVALVVRSNSPFSAWSGQESALEDASSPEDSTPAPLTITPTANELVAPTASASSAKARGNAPATSAAPETPAQTPVPADDPAWLAYLADTKRVVTDNAGTLVPAGDAVMLALKASDRIALGALMAPGEGDQSEYLRDLALKYPAIQSYSTLPTVNVYSVGGTTVYLSYRLATWEDGGIVSQHAIPIPLRFVDGTWMLTTLSDTGSNPLFVQSVSL